MKKTPMSPLSKIAASLPVANQGGELVAATAKTFNGFFPLLLAAYATLLFRDATAGAFRYYGDIHGISFVWYLPDLLACLYFALVTVRKLKQGNLFALFLLAVLSFYSILGYLTTQSLLSVSSATKMLLPFFVGLYAAESKDRIITNKPLHIFILVLSVLGILWSQDTQLPWTNYVAINEFGVARTAANQRWIAGIDRLTGFASDSTAAGYAIMLSVIFLMKSARLHIALLLAAFAAYPIYLTTSRTAGVALGVYVIAVVLNKINYEKTLRKFFVIISIAFLLFPFIVPIIGVVLSYDDVPSWATSMMDRVKSTWVNPFIYMFENYTFGFLTGMGMGSVAFPVKFSPVLGKALNCADNFMLANYIMFGLVAIWSTISLLKRAHKSLAPDNLAILISFLAYGIAIQGYGVSTYALIVGLLLGNLQNRKQAVPKPTCLIRPRSEKPDATEV